MPGGAAFPFEPPATSPQQPSGRALESNRVSERRGPGRGQVRRSLAASCRCADVSEGRPMSRPATRSLPLGCLDDQRAGPRAVVTRWEVRRASRQVTNYLSAARRGREARCSVAVAADPGSPCQPPADPGSPSRPHKQPAWKRPHHRHAFWSFGKSFHRSGFNDSQHGTAFAITTTVTSPSVDSSAPPRSTAGVSPLRGGVHNRGVKKEPT